MNCPMKKKYMDRPLTTSFLFNFVKNDNPTCGHNLKIFKDHVRSKQFQMFFTNRIINRQNNLTTEIVNSDHINSFKNCIDHMYRDIMFTTNIKDTKK